MILFIKNQKVNTLIASLSLLLFFSSCNDEKFSTDQRYKLSFSRDTLSFDTVFSTVASPTVKVLIRNKNNMGLRISQLYIMNKENSFFHINVDGSSNPLNSFKNIEIKGKDSLYVFVSVKVPSQVALNPVYIEDKIICVVNGKYQEILLQAYGQDVNIVKSLTLENDSVFSPDKPYLIIDSLKVSSGKTLKLLPGCKLYFHNNANLYVYGNLLAEGDFNHPILMRGDRFDKINFSTPIPYNYVAGQWGGVYLIGSKGRHSLNHVKVSSGTNGIFVVNENINSLPDVKIYNSSLHNFTRYGLVLKNANAEIVNTEISNSGSYCVFLSGGYHAFYHCTIANYFSNSMAQAVSRDNKPALMIMDLEKVAKMKTDFYNSVVAGTAYNEWALATRFPESYHIKFNHCYIVSSSPSSLPQLSSENVIWSGKNDTLFSNVRIDMPNAKYFDFTPDSLSILRGRAALEISVKFPLDMNGNSRVNENKPDIGAYQWQPSIR